VSAYAGLELLTTAVLMLDESLHVTYANPAAETLFAQGPQPPRGIPFHRALPANDEFEQRLAHALENELGFNDNDLLLEVEGYPAHLHCVISPVEAAGETRLVLEFRELQQQLKIAREEKILEQQEANRELIRNLAHEIKNPLGGIRGAAQLLERELGRPGAARVHPGDREGDRPPAIAHEPPPHPQPPAAGRDAERARGDRARAHPAARGVPARPRSEARLRHEPPDLPGDKEQLIQAILNVARQRRAGDPGARRDPPHHPHRAQGDHRSACTSATRWPVSIEDDGPGVPAELADRIFYPLVSGREGGTGLGLSLAQSFVSQHHG
jgi:two-component system nitrogen regulation sensor histidine kinase GlnL